MGYNHTHWQLGECLDEKREFVDILDNDVKFAFREDVSYSSATAQGKGMSASEPVHLNTRNRGSWCCSLPPRRYQYYFVAPIDQPAEDLKEMDLGSTGLRVVSV